MVDVPRYREELSCDCPTPGAEEIRSARVLYRMIKGPVPTERDFDSFRKRNPNRALLETSKLECFYRGLSLFIDAETARIRTQRRMSKYRICKVSLQKGAGMLFQAGEQDGHFTWWPYSDFKILDYCEVVQDV